MAFREKSAWVMGALMLAAGLYYLNMAIGVSREIGWTAPPMAIFIPYVILVIIASVAAQTTLAILSPREASASADERERPVLDRAGNWSGIVLAVGAVTALLHYLSHGNGNLLFHSVMGSMILSVIAEYAFQIILFRRSA
jgi:hypothetical protein